MSAELDEIWTLYADDGAQSLDVMEQSLLSLKENPEQAEHIAALFRSIHTFKGNARVLGLAAIEACAHASEDLVGLVRDENVPLDADLIALLLDAGDVLRAMMNDSLARRADPSPEGSSDLIGRIKAKIAQCRAKQREMSEPQAIIFEPVERKTLAQDLLYLEIFQSMAAETLEEARKLRPSWQAGEAADCRQLFAGVERLAFAAAQIGKAAWAEDLSKFLASGVLTVAKFYALIAKIESFMSGGCQAEAPERAPAEPQDASAGLLDAPSLPVTGLAALIGESAKLEMPAVAAGRSMLAADDTYRAIFFDMVSDILREMQAALGEFEADPKLLREALAQRAGLFHASEQIGMPGWLDLLSEFAGRPEVTAEEARDFVAKLEALALKNGEAAYAVAEEACAGDPIRRFFDNLPAQLATVSTYGGLLSSGRPVDADAFFAAAAQIREMAEELGFVRIADIAGQIACEREFSAFRRLELRLFEELAAVEQSAPSQLAGAALVPGAVLQNWCADQAFDALIELSHSLDEMHKEPGSTPCDGVIELFRLIYHACRHYHMETAAHLSMSLIDLFSRARDDRTPPDPMLLRISRSFSADLEILLDTAGSGGTPDMALIERLFEEAANVTFTANGTISSSIIESRLGLPKSFRKVLTPESLKTAAAAMNQGLQFYIVRAALNGDEKIAGGFLDWINSGTASVVSNVTVFDGADTLFDFLLATPLGESELAESLATLDPKGAALKIEMVLNRSGAAQRGAQEAGKRPGNEVNGSVHKPAAQDSMPRDMLEGIGEIVTGHAMIYRTLGDLVSEDIARTVEAEVRRSGGDWTKAKDAVRAALEAFTARIERAYQAEAQLSTQLERLQEEAIAVRSRPAALLTKPLEAFAESVARENGRRIKMDVGGNDELVLDHAMLEELKPHLRSLLTFCVTLKHRRT